MSSSNRAMSATSGSNEASRLDRASRSAADPGPVLSVAPASCSMACRPGPSAAQRCAGPSRQTPRTYGAASAARAHRAASCPDHRLDISSGGSTDTRRAAPARSPASSAARAALRTTTSSLGPDGRRPAAGGPPSGASTRAGPFGVRADERTVGNGRRASARTGVAVMPASVPRLRREVGRAVAVCG